MHRICFFALVVIVHLPLLGCGGTTADVAPNLTPDQEQEILNEVESAANSEQGQATEQ